MQHGQHGQRVKITGPVDADSGTRVVTIFAVLTEVPEGDDLMTMEVEEDGPFPVTSTIELLTCEFKVGHVGKAPSVASIDFGPKVGKVEMCGECRDFYNHLSERLGTPGMCKEGFPGCTKTENVEMREDPLAREIANKPGVMRPMCRNCRDQLADEV